jgi:hypothetical protein
LSLEINIFIILGFLFVPNLFLAQAFSAFYPSFFVHSSGLHPQLSQNNWIYWQLWQLAAAWSLVVDNKKATLSSMLDCPFSFSWFLYFLMSDQSVNEKSSVFSGIRLNAVSR